MTARPSLRPGPMPARPGLHKYKLVLEYDGSSYKGWQVQPRTRTIQGELLAAARQACGGDVYIQGAGRTDAGVHALGQTAHLECAAKLPPQRLLYGLNDALPPEIGILDVQSVSRQFHARHDATGRSYLYLIVGRRSVFARQYAWWLRDRLDLAAMRQAAAGFLGRHDFATFADKHLDDEKSTECQLEEFALEQWGELLALRVAGNRFLWKMVRRMTGIIVEVGRGKLRPADVPRLLAEPSPLPARHTAPCYGLYLEQIRYGSEPLRPLAVPPFPLAQFRARTR